MVLCVCSVSASAQRLGSVKENVTLTHALPSDDDAYLWLEDVESPAALEWVAKRNARTLEELQSQPGYGERLEAATRILEAPDRLVVGADGGRIIGDSVYGFWQDSVHVRGLWRRVPWHKFVKRDLTWEPVLDVDALAKTEGRNHVFAGVVCAPDPSTRCLVRLSDGGGDAVSWREFDLETRAFVEGGFVLGESKSSLVWVDDNTLLLADARSEHDRTTSGYPSVVRLWARGTDPQAAPLLFRGEPADVSSRAVMLESPTERIWGIYRATSFYTGAFYGFSDGFDGGSGAEPALARWPIPEDAIVEGLHRGHVLLSTRSAVDGFEGGSVVACAVSDLRAGQFRCEAVFVPTERQAVTDVSTAGDLILVSYLDDVRSRIMAVRRLPATAPEQATWQRWPLDLGPSGTASVRATSTRHTRYLVSYEDFLTPPQLFAADGDRLPQEPVQATPPRFDARGLQVTQRFATSADGTEVPYFLVYRAGTTEAHSPVAQGSGLGTGGGPVPTLLYGYGGFELAMKPSYQPLLGKLWLEAGGAYALAGIRGGGEYGPRWHRAALRENRQRAFDDFSAVAEALVASGVTTAKRLGIQGGSNGGLLMGASYTQRPGLFGAVVCQVPLLDMLRFHKLLAGASWMAEYGNPEVPADAAFLRQYSPFHNISPEVSYPDIFFLTSTRDDRVHPGHARKMAARLEALGHNFSFFENTEGGHAGAANHKQAAQRSAFMYTFLFSRLVGPGLPAQPRHPHLPSGSGANP